MKTEDLDPVQLAHLLFCPVDAEVVDQLRAWLTELPIRDARQALDLFYIEQRVCGWAGPMSQALAAESKFELWPLNSRAMIAHVLSLPDRYRASGTLNVDLIRDLWPELLEIPINQGPAIMRPYLILLGRRDKLRWWVRGRLLTARASAPA